MYVDFKTHDFLMYKPITIKWWVFWIIYDNKPFIQFIWNYMIDVYKVIWHFLIYYKVVLLNLTRGGVCIHWNKEGKYGE